MCTELVWWKFDLPPWHCLITSQKRLYVYYIWSVFRMIATSNMPRDPVDVVFTPSKQANPNPQNASRKSLTSKALMPTISTEHIDISRHFWKLTMMGWCHLSHSEYDTQKSANTQNDSMKMFQNSRKCAMCVCEIEGRHDWESVAYQHGQVFDTWLLKMLRMWMWKSSTWFRKPLCGCISSQRRSFGKSRLCRALSFVEVAPSHMHPSNGSRMSSAPRCLSLMSLAGQGAWISCIRWLSFASSFRVDTLSHFL